MLRKLLACLALLTGLAAAGTPVQAEVAAAVASRIEASAPDGAAARGQIAAPSARRAVRGKFPAAVGARPLHRVILRVPVVHLGSDRARE